MTESDRPSRLEQHELDKLPFIRCPDCDLPIYIDVEAMRVSERERVAGAIEDNPGPDPSPASPAWWAGWIEGRDDAAKIVREVAMADECGGCRGLGSHKRWCPQTVSRRAAIYGPDSEALEEIADRIGANHPELANLLYGASADLREWATQG